MKVLTTKLDDDEFEEFLEICNEEGCSKSEMLRKLVKDHIAEMKYLVEESENETTKEEEVNQPKRATETTVTILKD